MSRRVLAQEQNLNRTGVGVIRMTKWLRGEKGKHYSRFLSLYLSLSLSFCCIQFCGLFRLAVAPKVQCTSRSNLLPTTRLLSMCGLSVSFSRLALLRTHMFKGPSLDTSSHQPHTAERHTRKLKVWRYLCTQDRPPIFQVLASCVGGVICKLNH